jgi:hypothetical protein
LAFGSTWKDHNRCLKVVIMGCQFYYKKRLVELATLKRCHRLCGVD